MLRLFIEIDTLSKPVEKTASLTFKYRFYENNLLLVTDLANVSEIGLSFSQLTVYPRTNS